MTPCITHLSTFPWYFGDISIILFMILPLRLSLAVPSCLVPPSRLPLSLSVFLLLFLLLCSNSIQNRSMTNNYLEIFLLDCWTVSFHLKIKQDLILSYFTISSNPNKSLCFRFVLHNKSKLNCILTLFLLYLATATSSYDIKIHFPNYISHA